MDAIPQTWDCVGGAYRIGEEALLNDDETASTIPIVGGQLAHISSPRNPLQFTRSVYSFG